MVRGVSALRDLVNGALNLLPQHGTEDTYGHGKSVPSLSRQREAVN